MLSYFTRCVVLVRCVLVLRCGLAGEVFQEVEAYIFQDNRHIKVIKLPAPRTSRLYSQEMFPVLISVTDSVNPRTIVRPEGLCQ